MATSSDPRRRAQLQQRLVALHDRIAAAAAVAGRRAEEITLIAVTKTWPASDIAELASLGVADLGENRAQELAAKTQQLSGIAGTTLRWHFIGQLQRNKAAFVARHCFAVHTVDRAALVEPLDRAAQRAGHRLQIFVQLSLDGDPARGGVTEDAVHQLAEQVAKADGLQLTGVMGIPPLGAPPRPAFARLRAVSERLRATYPSAAGISAGMSDDLEEAVIEGATHLRVGTGLMGFRA